MCRYGRAAVQAARVAGRPDIEAAAQFYAIHRTVVASSADVAETLLDAAAARCRQLRQPLGLKLLQLTRAGRLYMESRFIEALQIADRVLGDADDLHPVELFAALERRAYSCKWSGRNDEMFEANHRAMAVADAAAHRYAMSTVRINLGGSLTTVALDPEGALPLLQRARELLLPVPVTHAWLATMNNRIVALDMLGRHQEAYAVFTEDLARPGAMALAPASTSSSVLALIGVGRLAEAEHWLGPQPQLRKTQWQLNALQSYRIAQLRLLCAQGRWAPAREYALACADHVDSLYREPTFDITVNDRLREACMALGDQEGAMQAALAARRACLPVVRISARARYLVAQLQAGLTGAHALRAIDMQRLQTVEKAVQAHQDEEARQRQALIADADADAEAGAEAGAGAGAEAAAAAAAPAPVPPPAPQVPSFVAQVVHELRNPIGGVMGMAELLMRSELDPKQRQFVQLMRSSADTLLLLVNDVLDLAKLESGRFEFNPTAVELAPWLDEVVGPFVEQARLKKVALGHALAAELPPRLVFDRLRLRQVLGNLLSNAVKFTRIGRIDVAVLPLGDTGGPRAGVRFEVRDSGCGISQAAQQRLFQEFVQADATVAGEYGGTGLGLALCRQMIQRMGGRIGVDSAEGKGSCFWFEVTLEAPPAPAASAADDAGSVGGGAA